MPLKTLRKITVWILLFAAGYAVAIWGASQLPGSFGTIAIWVLACSAVWAALYVLDMTVPGINIFSKALVRLPGGENRVALTFDDGPVEPFTRQILDVLDQFNAKATFFCIGENLQSSPELAKEIVRRGHTLGNHSFDHHSLPLQSGVDVSDQIERTAGLIERLTGSRSRLFRCPKGYKTRRVARLVARSGHHLIGFSYPIFDVQNPDTKILVSRVLTRLRAGDIILMHDGYASQKPGGRDQLVKALPRILEGIRQRGLKPVSLNEVLFGASSTSKD